MLKALIVGADSVAPNIILENKKLFPTLSNMMDTGVFSSYSAYVQKGYEGSYSSEQNWSSIYTGLPPKEHGINTEVSRGEKRRPQMKDFDDLLPFWKVLNENELSVGLWAADNCVEPVDINGYVVSAKYTMISTPQEFREAPRKLHMSSKSKEVLRKILTSEPTSRLYPKTLKQQGYNFEDLKSNSELAEKAVREYHFQEGVKDFERELSYWFNAMKKAQETYPVDVLFFYTPTTDLIAHCSMCSDENEVLIESYKILDKYMGELIKELNPEIKIFLSDHGQQNFKDLIKCSDPIAKREAFTAKDDVLWLKNGYIAFEGHNGSLLFTAHALKGTFIASGKGIKKAVVEGMRTLDIYSNLLEMFNIKIPEDRKGFVHDIFSKEIVNTDKMFDKNHPKKKIAILQTHAVSIMDIVINEIYIDNRFADITVVGEKKYEEIFTNNPRVNSFSAFENFLYDAYDEVYCGFYNKDSGVINHIKIGGEK